MYESGFTESITGRKQTAVGICAKFPCDDWAGKVKAKPNFMFPNKVNQICSIKEWM